jgi:superfamily II DNA or RNA helicase
MSAIRYSFRDLQRGLSAAYVQRGQRYAQAGRVHARDYDRAANRYRARVTGGQPEPYLVDARVLGGRAGARVYGTCTCPVAVNCKHVAAVLIDALARGGRDGEREHGPAAEWPQASAPRAHRDEPVPAEPRDTLPYDLSSWLTDAEQAVQPPARRAQDLHAQATPQRVLYLLEIPRAPGRTRLLVRLHLARPRKNGGYSPPRPWRNERQALHSPARFVTPEDQRVLRLLMVDAQSDEDGVFALAGGRAPELLRALIGTGRCHYGDAQRPALAEAPPRSATAQWEFEPDGTQQLRLRTLPPCDVVLPLAPPWYLELRTGACGPVETGLPPALAEMLARAPAVEPRHAPAVRAALTARAEAVALPLPQVLEEVSERVAPQPCLQLSRARVGHAGARALGYYLDVASLEFDYAGLRVARDPTARVTVFRDGKLVHIARNREAERRAEQRLREAGMVKLGGSRAAPASYYTYYDAQDWFGFMADTLPQLREAGWHIEIDDSFGFRSAQVGPLHAAVHEAGRDWFDLELGVEIDGRSMPLLPILLAAVRAQPELLSEPAAPGAKSRSLIVRLEDGRFAPIPLARVRPLVALLHELIDQAPTPRVRMSRLDAARLCDLEQAAELTWHGGETLRALGSKLAAFEGIAPVAAPRGLQAQLRPYQAQGLAWLQFLREYGLNGVLADDMGLGKTVQALAHLLVEKEAGRLTRPSLVVCPTSLVPNWKAEAARFAPSLRVHVSHGLARKAALEQLGAHDLVITTYALLARDEKALSAQPFHIVILDEAQQIKNANTLAARVVTRLQANHRLCLTGTPLENHLGELWSLIHFLMPGFLGDARSFRQLYRNPIEKHGDELRRASLARRLRPFILRRTKGGVAAELPAKSEIVVPVELADAQRDLYETVRAAMDERVRAEIAARGLERSQIVVLDALLKLRQICCDPRLLKLDAAKKVKASAKLEALLELLDELLQGGHRVLLFSQFTSMLELIEASLDQRGIAYVKLTGETRDRAKPVKAFQSGAVPLFLVSLKAGGTGLNLAAADTVIHYDPWWNPAVENQATDRAHRIGQDKPVFVYKLIVSGSVEEKIAQLQQAKAALAAGVLGEGGAAAAALGAEDIRALFEPLQ